MGNSDSTLVSVVVPTYNRAGKLMDCVNSIIRQTYENLQIIIVDDGSTDDTEAVVRGIPDGRIVYVKQENGGACVARNNGISHSEGAYIAFNDSDDVWNADKISRQLAFIQNSDYDMIFCGMNRTVNGAAQFFPPVREKYEALTLERELAESQVSTQTIMIRTEVADAVRFDTSFKRLQDWDFTLRVLENGYRVGFLCEALVSAEPGNDSITNRVKAEEAYLHLIEKHRAFYDKYSRSLARIYETLAYRLKDQDRALAGRYLMKSMKMGFNPKTTMKIVANKFGLW